MRRRPLVWRGFIPWKNWGWSCADRGRRWAWTRPIGGVALTDGGNGLEAFIDSHFPRAVKVSDFHHATGQRRVFPKFSVTHQRPSD